MLLYKRVVIPPSPLSNGEGRPCGLTDRVQVPASAKAPRTVAQNWETCDGRKKTALLAVIVRLYSGLSNPHR